MSNPQLAPLQAAAVDGRAENVFFRQTQLERLCKGLLAEEANLRQAMVSDLQYTQSEAIGVLHAAVQTVKDRYATLKPTAALEREYRLAHGKDADDEERPFGLVYIEPEAHSLLYAVCAPLSAAIAAGNCVAVLLENNLREMPSLLRKILTGALDHDTFTVLSSPVKDSQFLENAIVIRRSTEKQWPRINELLCPSGSPAVAIVDRTADVALAAREIASARRAFGSRSPYSPDVVLINEFAMQDFLESLQSGLADHKQQSPPKGYPSAMHVNLQTGSITTPKSDKSLLQALRSKTQEPLLFIQPIRSLDDAINLLDEHASGPYIAAYHFSDLRSAKYLSQFVDAEVTFANQIPSQLLIGPAAPRGKAFDLHHRFPISLFSKQRPAFVQQPRNGKELAAALASGDNASAQELLKRARQPLKAMKRSEGGGVGFFEQGILLSVSFIFVSLVTVSATGAWQLWKYSRR